MAIPANYYASTTTLAAQLINVRRGKRVDNTGEVKGTNFIYAERSELEVYLIFDRAEVPSPARNGLVMLATGESFFIDAHEPIDGFTITTKAVPARAEQIPVGAAAP